MPLFQSLASLSARGLVKVGASKPSAPSITSVSTINSTSITLNYTLGNANGSPITTIAITSSPSLSLTIWMDQLL